MIIKENQVKSQESINYNENLANFSDYEINAYIEKVKKMNEYYDSKIENVKLNNLIKDLKKENKKISKAKELFEGYKQLVKEKDFEIKRVQKENLKLNNDLEKIPWIIRYIFIKEK